MGLDVYFTKSVGPGMTAEPPEFPRKVSLCGGMFSGHGENGSFRGKVYSPFIEEAISCDPEYSLYKELTPNQLIELADWIDEWLSNNDGNTFTFQYELNRQEIEDLALTFRVFGEAGYGTYAWY